MLSKPCGELYCHALAYCDMCGRLPFSAEYKLKVSRPQGAGAALCVLWMVVVLSLMLYTKFDCVTFHRKSLNLHDSAQYGPGEVSRGKRRYVGSIWATLGSL